MAQLAIKGHATRGNEVIEILEMLGGEREGVFSGNVIDAGYYIDSNGYIDYEYANSLDNTIIYTLKEFLETYPYKVGDKVQFNNVTPYGPVYEIEKMIWEYNQVKYTIHDLYNENLKVTVNNKDIQFFQRMQMENKINIAEILKSCPIGMELDCTIWNGVTFEGIDSSSPSYPIKIKIKGDKTTVTEYLTKFGEWNTNENSKCVIYPKDKTTWEGFVSPHKYQNGDIVITALGSTAIIKGPVYNTEYYAHCVWVCGKLITDDTIGAIRFATESEKAELFQAIKDNGYKWNEETKTLEKLIEPKFKVGNRVRNKYYKDYIYDIHDITDKGYRAKEIDADSPIIILFGSQEDNYELVPGKFDISTLKPFESRVLVRSTDDDIWRPAIYGFADSNRYYVVGGIYWKQCIPYEANKELLGTINNPEYFLR